MQLARITQQPAASAAAALLVRLRLLRDAQRLAQCHLLLGIEPDGVLGVAGPFGLVVLYSDETQTEDTCVGLMSERVGRQEKDKAAS